MGIRDQLIMDSSDPGPFVDSFVTGYLRFETVLEPFMLNLL
jgi:hypothetical protein